MGNFCMERTDEEGWVKEKPKQFFIFFGQPKVESLCKEFDEAGDNDMLKREMKEEDMKNADEGELDAEAFYLKRNFQESSKFQNS